MVAQSPHPGPLELSTRTKWSQKGGPSRKEDAGCPDLANRQPLWKLPVPTTDPSLSVPARKPRQVETLIRILEIHPPPTINPIHRHRDQAVGKRAGGTGKPRTQTTSETSNADDLGNLDGRGQGSDRGSRAPWRNVRRELWLMERFLQVSRVKEGQGPSILEELWDRVL